MAYTLTWHLETCEHGQHPHLDWYGGALPAGECCTNDCYGSATSGRSAGEFSAHQGVSFPYIRLATSSTLWWYFNPNWEDVGGSATFPFILAFHTYVGNGTNYLSLVLSETASPHVLWVWSNYFRDPDDHHPSCPVP